MSEPVFFYCVQCQMQLSEPHHHDDGRRGMSDDLHRWSCDAAVSGSLSRCDCDGPTALADLRERLAAAIEGMAADVTSASGYIDATDYAYANGLTDAANLVRNRP